MCIKQFFMGHKQKQTGKLLCDRGVVSSCKMSLLTFWPHSNTKAFLETTLLTFSPHIHINLTVIAIFALVHSILGDAASKKA